MNKVVEEKTDEEKLEECSLKLRKLMSLIKKDNAVLVLEPSSIAIA